MYIHIDKQVSKLTDSSTPVHGSQDDYPPIKTNIMYTFSYLAYLAIDSCPQEERKRL